MNSYFFSFCSPSIWLSLSSLLPRATSLFYSFRSAGSFYPSQGAKCESTVVLKPESLTRRCHSAVPHHCFTIMRDLALRDSSSFSNVWATPQPPPPPPLHTHTHTTPPSHPHCDWPTVFSVRSSVSSSRFSQFKTMHTVKFLKVGTLSG